MAELKKVPEAVRLVLQPDTVQKLVDLYRHAKESGDSNVVAAANDAMKYFHDAETALTRMMAAEATVNAFVRK